MNHLPPRPVADWDDATRTAFVRHLRRPDLHLGDDPRPMPNVLGLLAHHPKVGEAWLTFNAALAEHTKLDDALREVVILRVAWLTRCGYEWTHHVHLGRRAGLTLDHVRAVPDGPANAVWSRRERAALTATDEVVDDHALSDGSWAELRNHFDDPAILELIILAGAYLSLTIVANSAGLEPDEGVASPPPPWVTDPGA